MNRDRRQRSRRVRVAVAMAGVLVLVVIATVWLRDGDDGPPSTQQAGDVAVEHRWSVDLPARDGPDDDFEGDTPRVAIDGDTAFVARHGRVQAIDLASGDRRWEADLGRPVRGLAATGGLVAVGLEVPSDHDEPDRPAGEVAVYEGRRGDSLWGDVALEAQPTGLVIAGDIVVADLGDDGLQAVDLTTGEERWHRPGYTDPCWNGTALYALGGGIARLAPADGEPAAGPVDTGTGDDHVLCSPDAAVAVGTDRASLHAPDTLNPAGTVSDVRCCGVDQVLDGPSLVTDTIEPDTDSAQCCPHTLVAVDATTGAELWRHRTPLRGSSPLRYRHVGDLLVLTNGPGGSPDDGGDHEEGEPLTRLLDADGEPLGDIDTGIDTPEVLESDPTGDTFIVGDAHEVTAFRVRD